MFNFGCKSFLGSPVRFSVGCVATFPARAPGWHAPHECTSRSGEANHHALGCRGCVFTPWVWRDPRQGFCVCANSQRKRGVDVDFRVSIIPFYHPQMETRSQELTLTVRWCPPPSAAEKSTTDLVISDTCDEDDETCLFEIGANGRLAEPLEAAIPMDYYALLQLDFDATAKDVKSQYRQLQKWCHPDIAGAAGTEVSIILNEAYDTLMDENERAVYDRDLRELQVRVAFPKSADCFPTRD